VAVVRDGRTLYDTRFNRVSASERGSNDRVIFPDGMGYDVEYPSAGFKFYHLVKPWTGYQVLPPLHYASVTQEELVEIRVAILSLAEPAAHGFNSAAWDKIPEWREANLEMEPCRERIGCTIYRPGSRPRTPAELAPLGLAWAASAAAWSGLRVRLDRPRRDQVSHQCMLRAVCSLVYWLDCTFAYS